MHIEPLVCMIWSTGAIITLETMMLWADKQLENQIYFTANCLLQNQFCSPADLKIVKL